MIGLWAGKLALDSVSLGLSPWLPTMLLSSSPGAGLLHWPPVNEGPAVPGDGLCDGSVSRGGWSLPCRLFWLEL